MANKFMSVLPETVSPSTISGGRASFSKEAMNLLSKIFFTTDFGV
jgi:hypothetical protein